MKSMRVSIRIWLNAVAALCLCAVAMTATSAARAASPSASSFWMEEGASVCLLEDTEGIRFTASCTEDKYAEVAASDDKQCGMLITKKAYLDGIGSEDVVAYLESQKTALGKQVTYVLITESSDNPIRPYRYMTADGVVYRINGVLTDIKYDNMDAEWLGIGVIVTGSGTAATYEYAEYTVNDARRISYVASAALTEETSLTAAQQGTLKNYIYKTAAKLSGASENDYAADFDAGMQARYADAFTVKVSAQDVAPDGAAYLPLNGKTQATATVENAAGAVLDIVTTMETESEAVSLEDGTVTALSRGYGVIVASAPCIAEVEPLIVYTGSVDMMDGMGDMWLDVQGEGVTQTVQPGEIAGNPYFGSLGPSGDAYLAVSPKTTSMNYLDHLADEGYDYIRQYYYLQSVSDVKTVRFWTHKALAGEEKIHKMTVAANCWIAIDVPMPLYRYYAACGATGSTVATANARLDAYGMVTANNYAWHTSFLAFEKLAATDTVYIGRHTAVKESAVTVTAKADTVTADFAQKMNFADRFTVGDGRLSAQYRLDGEPTSDGGGTMLFSRHTVAATVYAHTLCVSDYTPGGAGAWVPSSSAVTDEASVTVQVNGGLAVNPVNLVEMDGGDVTVDTYTESTKLEEAGYTVGQSVVKRYSDGSPMSLTDGKLPADSESGVYTVTVTATKDAETVGYQTVLDLYRAADGCEYENFKHADSGYAVTVEMIQRGFVHDTAVNAVKRVSETNGGVPLTSDAIAIQNGTLTFTVPDSYSGATCSAYLYVTARHSKAFYERYRDQLESSVLSANNISGDKVGNGFTRQYLVKVNDDSQTCDVLKNQAWSARNLNQYTQVDLNNMIDHFDCFYSGTVMLAAYYQPYNLGPNCTIDSIGFEPKPQQT